MIVDDIRPGQFLESLDRATRHLFERTAFFMTFAILRIDLSARRIDYSTAGHPPQWLIRSGGDVEELATPSIALGLGPTTLERRAGRTTYAPGDTLLLFTDGLFEVSAPNGELWGDEALKSLFVRVGRSAPEVVVAEVLREATGFRGAPAFADDVSLMVARLGTQSPLLDALEPAPSERAQALR
jgi:sigma-B regulation protein RsbU (phosphoserine phosphatase)